LTHKGKWFLAGAVFTALILLAGYGLMIGEITEVAVRALRALKGMR